jgi:hypothetical protein
MKNFVDRQRSFREGPLKRTTSPEVDITGLIFRVLVVDLR